MGLQQFQKIQLQSQMYEPPRRHRKSGINFEELLNKEWSILTKAEYSELQTSFKRTDQRNGGICFYDLINILRNAGLSISEERKDKINKDFMNKEVRVLNFDCLLNTAAMLKKERDENNKGEIAEENEYLDAFVALGGSADKSGYVNRTSLMEIVKREFELSLDLEAVIDGLQNDNLDYDVFCSIFEADKEKNEGRLASAASQRSLKSQGSTKSLIIDDRDFQKFLSQYETDEY